MKNKKLLLCSLALMLSGCSSSSSDLNTTQYTKAETTSVAQASEASSSQAPTAEDDTDTTTADVIVIGSTAVEETEAETKAEVTTEAETEAGTEATTEATTDAPTEAPTEQPETTPVATEPVKMYTTASVNVRIAPSTNDEKVALYPEKTEVLVYAIENGWAQIKHEDKICYISADYLTADAPAPETTPEATTQATTEAPTEATTAAPSEVPPAAGNITVTAVSYCGVLYKQGDGPTVCIDPGHMGRGDSTQEPSAPGSSETKARATTGTEGCVTHIHESVVNLQTSLQLRDVLLSRGYNVMMTRESEDVNISNMERALMASNDGADILVRVHCNSVVDQNVNGIVTMAPSAANPYVAHLYNQCYSLSDHILNSMVAATGAGNKGILLTDTMSGINWSSIPVTIVEMGFMSNPTEDQLLCDASYQAKLVQGMANGIDAYFGR